MVNGKMPLYLTTLVLGLLAAVLMLSQPYSADFPGTAYAQPAREYIHAAFRQDSARLVRLSASIKPVVWGLTAARAHHESLALWMQGMDAWTGRVEGDTAQVFVYPTTNGCSKAPIIFRFVGKGRNARVLEATSDCWSP